MKQFYGDLFQSQSSLKDFCHGLLDHDGDAGHKAAGEGLLNYDLYLRLLQTNHFQGPLLLHGLTRTQVPTSLAFLRAKLARAAG